MPHRSLHDSIDKFGPFDPTVTPFYCFNIVCAIGFIHSHRLVSRDIEPSNYLVGPDGYLVMTDLGIAK
jgi:serine/threonine protein kinase